MKQESTSFLKKRSKKLLPISGFLLACARTIENSFLVLFFKKELLPK
jgi:hypothetical protein